MTRHEIWTHLDSEAAWIAAELVRCEVRFSMKPMPGGWRVRAWFDTETTGNAYIGGLSPLHVIAQEARKAA